MFLMQQLGRHKLALGHDLNGVHAYNKMHVRYKIQVKWGTRELENGNEKD
jgi:hypothetical protein